MRNTHLQTWQTLSHLRQASTIAGAEATVAFHSNVQNVCIAYWCSCWTMSSKARPLVTCMSISLLKTSLKGSLRSQCAQVDMSCGSGLPVFMYTVLSSTVSDAMCVDCRHTDHGVLPGHSHLARMNLSCSCRFWRARNSIESLCSGGDVHCVHASSLRHSVSHHLKNVQSAPHVTCSECDECLHAFVAQIDAAHV